MRGANIPNFPYPDTAARMFNYMWRYNDTLRAPYETPVLPGDAGSSLNRERARQILEAVRQEGRRDRRSLYRPGGRGRRAEGS